MFTISPLLAVLGFLAGRAAAVCTRDILLLLGLGLYLAGMRVLTVTATSERDAVLQYFLKVFFSCHSWGGIYPPLTRREWWE